MFGLLPFAAREFIVKLPPEQQGVKPKSLIAYYLDFPIPLVSAQMSEGLDRLVQGKKLQEEVEAHGIFKDRGSVPKVSEQVFRFILTLMRASGLETFVQSDMTFNVLKPKTFFVENKNRLLPRSRIIVPTFETQLWFHAYDFVFSGGKPNLFNLLQVALIVSHELLGHLSPEIQYAARFGAVRYMYESSKLAFNVGGARQVVEGYAMGIETATYQAIKEAYSGTDLLDSNRFNTYEELLPVWQRHPYPSDVWLEAVAEKVP